MKLFKKVAAVMLAMAMVFTFANTQVKAEKIITENVENGVLSGDGTFYYYAADAGFGEGVYGCRITFTVADESAGFGGGFVINTETYNWDSAEWGDATSGKAIIAEATGNAGEYTITRTVDYDVFAGTQSYKNFALQSWWGSDLDITKVELLDADGNVVSPAPAEEVAEEAAPAEEATEEVAEEAAATTDATPKTGDSINFVLVGSILVLAAFVIVAEKAIKKSKAC